MLLEPAAGEIARLRRLQDGLQARVGGRPQQRLHLTCQRFDGPDAATLRGLQGALTQELPALEAPPITAIAAVLITHEFWQMTMLRWEIEKNAALHRLLALLETTCLATGITPHYPYSSGWTPSTLTALEDVDASTAPARLEQGDYPQYLFSGRQLTLSRIVALRQFEIIASMQL